MSIYAKPNSPYWQFDFRLKGRRFFGTVEDESGRPIAKSTSRKRAEEREAVLKAETRVRLARGTPSAGPRRLSLDDALMRYWMDHAQYLPSGGNLWDYSENWKRIGARRRPTPLLQRNLDEITNDDIAWYVAQRRADRVRNADPQQLEDGTIVEPNFVSNRTVNADVEFLRAVFNRARDNWDVSVGEKPPRWGKHLLAVPEERVRSLTDEEAEAIFAALTKLRPDFLDVHLFLGLSGRREAEVFGLEKRRVDRRNMRYGVLEKGVRGTAEKRERWYPLSAEQLAIIERNWMHHPTLVFTYVCQKSLHQPNRGVRLKKGERYPFTKDGWRRAFGEVLAEAGVTDFRVHDWRHDFATRVLQRTGNLKLAQKLLGHADIATTTKYAHVSEGAEREALAGAADGRLPKKSRTEQDGGGQAAGGAA